MKKVLLIITGFSLGEKEKGKEISKRELDFLSENNVASDCNVKFYHPKIQRSNILDSFLKEHVSYKLCVLFLEGISETGQGLYKTYISEKRVVSFLEKLPENVNVLET